MKQTRNHRAAYLLLTFLLTMLFSVSANAVDYTFSGTEAPDYYGSTAYEDVYGSRYNYGGVNIVDYRIPALEEDHPARSAAVGGGCCRHRLRCS